MDNITPFSSSLSSSTLCETCRAFFSGSWLQSWAAEGTRRNVATYHHHPSLVSLEACASRRDGCRLCITLFDCLRRFGGQLNHHENPEDAYSNTRVKCVIIWGRNTIRGHIRPKVETPVIELHFSLESSTDEAKTRKQGVFLHDLDLWPANLVLPHLSPMHRTEPGLVDTTASPETFEFIRQKLATCDATHTKCKPPQTSSIAHPYAPSRLIDVGASDDPTIKVVEAPFHQSETGEVRYITLSHSWGKAQIVTLSDDYADLLRDGGLLEILPRTFRDAITVTRRLGVRYIWIDSLCIIQDSREDWLEQAPQMQNTYKYAFLNISASLGVDSHSGLFRFRKAEALWPFPVEATWDDYGISLSPGAHGPRPGSYYCFDPYLWREDVDQSPLSLRAWVMQERILSPRACYFGHSQVYWQCHENEASEIFPDVEPEWSSPSKSALYEFVGTPNPMSLRRTLDEHEAKDTARLYREWNKFIEAYSTCRLTVDGDIFMALEGVAREFRDRTGDELIMGLWKSQLPAALCWYVEWDSVALNPSSVSHQFKPIRPREWRAPSWSWASMRLPVCYDTTHINFSDMESLVEVVAAENIEVRPGCSEPSLLRVRGRLFSGALIPRVDEEVASGQFRQKGKTIIWLEIVSVRVHARVVVCFDDSETLAPGSMRYTALMPVCKYRCRVGDNEKGYQVQGLLLGRSALRPGQYYRRGMYTMRDYHDSDELLRDVRPEQWMGYESRCEDTNLCTISII